MNQCWILSTALWVSFPCISLISCVTLIDFQIWNQLWILGRDPTWWWCRILFMCRWIGLEFSSLCLWGILFCRFCIKHFHCECIWFLFPLGSVVVIFLSLGICPFCLNRLTSWPRLAHNRFLPGKSWWLFLISDVGSLHPRISAVLTLPLAVLPGLGTALQPDTGLKTADAVAPLALKISVHKLRFWFLAWTIRLWFLNGLLVCHRPSMSVWVCPCVVWMGFCGLQNSFAVLPGSGFYSTGR